MRITYCVRLTYLAVIILLASCQNQSSQPYLPGDLVFQDLESPQSMAVKLATHSEYTHCGVIFEEDGQLVVYEAVQPVRVTPLDEWIIRGVGQKLVVKRLKDRDQLLSADALGRMKAVGQSHLGKDYDIYFGWSDDQLYCSELAWKIYFKGLGIELTKPRSLRDYNLSHEAVHQKMAERYGENIPLDEPVVAPSDLITSDLLETVFEDWD